MGVPIGLFTGMGKIGYNIYSYFYKGAKIDAALNFSGSHQRPHPGVSPKNRQDEATFFRDAIHVFDFKSDYELVLQNASGNPAYNVRLINADEIFSGHDGLMKNMILAPTASVTINCWFTSNNVHIRGSEADKYHGIPSERKNRGLIIAYDNEARVTFYTKFKIDDRNTINEYSLKKPHS